MLSLLYATARREHLPDVLDRWLPAARRVEAVVVTDGRPYDGPDRWSDPARNVSLVALANPGRRDAVAAWNLAARAARGDIFVQVSDDLFPPERWDEALWSRLDVNRPQVLAISDGLKADRLLRHAILTRRYYEPFAYLFHPSYESMYSDYEFTEVAYASGAVVEARDLLFEHRHPRRRAQGFAGAAAARDRLDAVGRAHEAPARYRHGRANFLYRKARGFPTDPTVALTRSLRDLPWVWFYFYRR